MIRTSVVSTHSPDIPASDRRRMSRWMGTSSQINRLSPGVLGPQFRDARGDPGIGGKIVAASVGGETVPTEVIGKPSAVIVVLTDGDQLAMRFTPKCGCRGKSRPEGRITSIHGAPARLRA